MKEKHRGAANFASVVISSLLTMYLKKMQETLYTAHQIKTVSSDRKATSNPRWTFGRRSMLKLPLQGSVSLLMIRMWQ